MKQSSRKDMFVIGFALFSMYFGAGNVIFPPYLGMSSGPEWVLGLICYYIADIGLALLAMFAILKVGSSVDIVRPIGNVFSVILMCAIIMCIGPMIAIPRTSAMTFELGVQPLTDKIGSALFSVLFFLVIFLLSVRENRVVDIIGKILTPLLLLGLIILIVKGIATPLGPVAETALADNIAQNGIKDGYQTMDVLATLMFGGVILRSAEDKGYRDVRSRMGITAKASIVSGVILLGIYCGLTYLGASVSTMYDLSVSRSVLVSSIVNGLLGQHGTILFSLVVALACVTTAVGLVSACGELFGKMSNGKIPYTATVIAVCVFSAVVSNVGLDQIVSIAGPILDIVYPPTLALIALTLVPNVPKLAAQLATVGSLAVSILTVLKVPFVHYLPLDSLGFGWIVPAALCALIGWLIGRKAGEKHA